MGLFQTLRWIVSHPLNERDRLRAVARFARWQLGSRILPGPVAVQFVDDARLLVEAGMAGATGSVYAGLHELADMAFVLHLLRPHDLFIDVGANVGTYTVIASAAAGARTIAVEPIPQTFQHLLDNIYLNRLDNRVDARNIGIGRTLGELSFTTDLDCVNHVVRPAETTNATIVVPATTLDELTTREAPCCIKVDVEGFEHEVVTGGNAALRQPSLLAVILELTNLGKHYGHAELEVHRQMLDFGFLPCRYHPFERRLEQQATKNHAGNTLYVRDIQSVRVRLQEAPRHRVLGRSL